MIDNRQNLIIAIEQCILQSLDGNKGRSNTKTSLLHGAIQQYIDQRLNVKWSHETKIKSDMDDQSFNIDVYATGSQNDIAMLLKQPVRSLSKNKKNSLVNTWGEAIRASLIRINQTKNLNVLSISIIPTIDIVIKDKNSKGGGKTTFHNYEADSPDYYNAGFDLIKPNKTRFRYVAINYDYSIPHTLKTLNGVLKAFKSIESGQRIKITDETWNQFDTAIDWMLEGF